MTCLPKKGEEPSATVREVKFKKAGKFQQAATATRRRQDLSQTGEDQEDEVQRSGLDQPLLGEDENVSQRKERSQEQ